MNPLFAATPPRLEDYMATFHSATCTLSKKTLVVQSHSVALTNSNRGGDYGSGVVHGVRKDSRFS